jgi:hypothetical protein
MSAEPPTLGGSAEYGTGKYLPTVGVTNFQIIKQNAMTEKETCAKADIATLG